MQENGKTGPDFILRVGKIHGDFIMQWISQQDILDFTWKIAVVENDLYIPLREIPAQLQSDLSNLDYTLYPSCGKICAVEFSPRDQKHIIPLKTLLKGKIPDPLLDVVPRAFDIIGSVAIIDLNREEQAQLQPFLQIIAKEFLSNQRTLTGVYGKAGDIEGIFRTRKLEFLAGTPNTETLHKENGCQFFLDIEKTFFTPRLVYERKRIADLVTPYSSIGITWDVFCGVGPFIIQIAKTHPEGTFLGTDINPDAIRYAQKNAQKNHLAASIEFIKQDIMQILPESPLEIYKRRVSRFIMNLPEKNLQFLSYIVDFIHPQGALLHIYQFNSKENSLDEAEKSFRQKSNECGIEIVDIMQKRIVKPFSPTKDTTGLDLVIKKKKN